jgi:hypothetical protein
MEDMGKSSILLATSCGSATNPRTCKWLRFSDTATTRSEVNVTALYDWMEKIAAKYDLTPEEFGYYCTIPAPTGGKVFYPFHALSRPQSHRVGTGLGHVGQLSLFEGHCSLLHS